MDYKKRFEEVFKWAKDAHSVAEGMLKEDLEHLFPELVESEDERIRKSIIGFLITISSLKDGKTVSNEDFDTKTILEWVAWLEKQSEKNPVDKIQLGKKYKCIASPRYSTFMIGEIYKPEDKFLCSLMNFCSDCFEPIEDGEQNPAEWSEEDIVMHNDCICAINAANEVDYSDEEKERLTNWLRHIRPQKQWKPTKEQIDAIYNILHPDDPYYDILKPLYEQLKALV